MYAIRSYYADAAYRQLLEQFPDNAEIRIRYGERLKERNLYGQVIEPKMDPNADGERVGLETFLIATAKRMDLPGFGDQAIPDAEGNLHPLNRPEDFV